MTLDFCIKSLGPLEQLPGVRKREIPNDWDRFSSLGLEVELSVKCYFISEE